MAAGKASCRGGRDPDVHATQHLHAARDTGAVHRRDHRLVELDVAQHRVGAVAQLAAVDFGDFTGSDLLLHLGDLGDVGLEVGAGHEVLPHTGDDGRPGIIVLPEPPPGSCQIAEVIHVQRVLGLGPINGDEHDVLVVLLVVDGHLSRCSSDSDGGPVADSSRLAPLLRWEKVAHA